LPIGENPATRSPDRAKVRQTATDPHTLFEDVQAIATACAFFSLGLGLIKHAGLLMGGAPGIALLIARVTPVPFGWAYLLVNLPFIALGARSKGWRYMGKTFVAVALLSFATDWLPSVLRLDRVDPVYAAVMGGALAGVGLLMLFRHEASLGGIGILAVWLQERYGVRAGIVQLAVDAAVLAASLLVVSPLTVALSIVGAVSLNVVLAVNHRAGRYMGT
jgi:uncharacterized membrane-anchored protein YitT (DUF2179 family)